MDGWNTSFLLGWPIFRCYVSFRECVYKLIMANVGTIMWPSTSTYCTLEPHTWQPLVNVPEGSLDPPIEGFEPVPQKLRVLKIGSFEGSGYLGYVKFTLTNPAWKTKNTHKSTESFVSFLYHQSSCYTKTIKITKYLWERRRATSRLLPLLLDRFAPADEWYHSAPWSVVHPAGLAKNKPRCHVPSAKGHRQSTEHIVWSEAVCLDVFIYGVGVVHVLVSVYHFLKGTVIEIIRGAPQTRNHSLHLNFVLTTNMTILLS